MHPAYRHPHSFPLSASQRLNASPVAGIAGDFGEETLRGRSGEAVGEVLDSSPLSRERSIWAALPQELESGYSSVAAAFSEEATSSSFTSSSSRSSSQGSECLKAPLSDSGSSVEGRLLRHISASLETQGVFSSPSSYSCPSPDDWGGRRRLEGAPFSSTRTGVLHRPRSGETVQWLKSSGGGVRSSRGLSRHSSHPRLPSSLTEKPHRVPLRCSSYSLEAVPLQRKQLCGQHNPRRQQKQLGLRHSGRKNYRLGVLSGSSLGGSEGESPLSYEDTATAAQQQEEQQEEEQQLAFLRRRTPPQEQRYGLSREGTWRDRTAVGALTGLPPNVVGRNTLQHQQSVTISSSRSSKSNYSSGKGSKCRRSRSSISKKRAAGAKMADSSSSHAGIKKVSSRSSGSSSSSRRNNSGGSSSESTHTGIHLRQVEEASPEPLPFSSDSEASTGSPKAEDLGSLSTTVRDLSAAAAAFLPVPASAKRVLQALSFRFSGCDELSQEGSSGVPVGVPLGGGPLCITPTRLPEGFFDSFPAGCLHAIFRFLLPGEILRVAGVCTAWREAVHGCLGAFVGVSCLSIGDAWLCLGSRKRQQALLQLQRLQQLEISATAFQKGGITIKEVAAVIARNTMEWLHIFCNCDFPEVENLEVTYFPLPEDHWSWTVLPDFTALGLRGLQRIINQMPRLQRLTLGLQILSETRGSLTEPESAFEAGRNSSSSSSGRGRRHRYIPLGDGWGYETPQVAPGAPEGPLGWRILPPQLADLGGPEPLGGRSRLSAYKGQITEADLSDIFAVAYVRAGGNGCLKRVVFVQRQPLQAPGGSAGNGEDLGALTEFISGAASFCARYVADMFRGMSEET